MYCGPVVGAWCTDVNLEGTLIIHIGASCALGLGTGAVCFVGAFFLLFVNFHMLVMQHVIFANFFQ